MRPRILLRVVVEGIKGGRLTRIVWDRNGGLNDFAVASINPDGTVNKMSTYFRLSRNELEKRGYLDVLGGKDVFEQYFDDSFNDLTNGVFK